MKIEKLTPEQEAYLPVFREEWLRVGLSTKEVDQTEATHAVKNLYAAAGLKEPIVMHFQSPWQCIMAINFFRKFGDISKANLWDNLRANLRADLWDNLWDNLRVNLWDNLWANLDDNLRANLRVNLWDNLGDNLWDNLRANLRANLGANLRVNLWDNLDDNLRDNLWDNLGANLGANLRANLGDNLWDNPQFVDTWFWAGQDAPWLAFYEFGEKIGVKYSKQDHFDAYKQFAKTCGWGYFYNGLAFVSDRPETIKKDAMNRLHCEDGPAFKFRDGYSVYCFEGKNVPAKWIEEKNSLTSNEVLKTVDIEQRVIGCKIIGWEKIPHTVLEGNPKSDIGALVEISLDGLPRPGRFLMAKCPRNGTICEGVPYESDIDGLPINTALAAQAWRIGDPQSEYVHPIKRS